MTVLPKAPTTDLTSTTLNGSINSSQTSAVVNDASTIQTPTYAWIDRQDINGNNTPNAREMIYVSSKASNTLTIARGVNNSTARAHNDSAILEPILSVGFWADAYSWATTDHLASDGSHDITKVAVLSGATIQTLANKILSSPTVVTPTIVSATYVSPILSSATLITPTVNAPIITGNVDGWTLDTDTWVYVSATSFKITGADRTARFTKGTRIKLTNSSLKYFVVTSSSFSTDTTVNVTGGSDYTLASAAITGNYYSYQASPQGYPTWFNYSPTFTGFSADPAGGVYRFRVMGTVAEVVARTVNDGTSNAVGFTISAPITAATVSNMFWQVPCLTRDNTANAGVGDVFIQSNTASFTIEKSFTSANFTASGGKGAYFTIAYEI